MRRRDFPFFLERKPRAAPSRIRISFVVAHMAHWPGGIEFFHPAKCELKPSSIALFPIQRRIPALRANHVPSIGEPKLGPAITTITHEFQVLGIRDQRGGDPERPQEHFVLWPCI